MRLPFLRARPSQRRLPDLFLQARMDAGGRGLLLPARMREPQACAPRAPACAHGAKGVQASGFCSRPSGQRRARLRFLLAPIRPEARAPPLLARAHQAKDVHASASGSRPSGQRRARLRFWLAPIRPKACAPPLLARAHQARGVRASASGSRPSDQRPARLRFLHGPVRLKACTPPLSGRAHEANEPPPLPRRRARNREALAPLLRRRLRKAETPAPLVCVLAGERRAPEFGRDPGRPRVNARIQRGMRLRASDSIAGVPVPLAGRGRRATHAVSR